MITDPAGPSSDPWVESYSREEATSGLVGEKKGASPLLNGNPRKTAVELFKPATTLDDLPEYVAEELPPPDPDEEQWRIQDWSRLALRLKSSLPIANVSNIAIVLAEIRSGRIWFDEFLQKILTQGNDGPREWTDADDILITMEVQRRCGIATAAKQVVRDAVIQHAYKDTRNELQDWLRGLEWDGTDRIENFFSEVCGAKEGPYMRSVARNFFLSLVARAMRPGCKADNMIVLEGEQGAYKSTLLEVLGGRWYTVMREAPTSKDFEITLQGKWLIEVAEFDSFSRADVKATKRTLSTATDRYRSPYGVHAADHPRHSIFAGTVNPSDWNTDPTGARRFWPVAIGRIDIAAVPGMREQLFAEAMHLFARGATWYEIDAASAKVEQDDRYIDDPWSDVVEYQCRGRAMVKIGQLLEDMSIPIERQDKTSQMRIAAILTHAGFKRRTVYKHGKVWLREGKIPARPEPAAAEDDGPPEDLYGRDG